MEYLKADKNSVYANGMPYLLRGMGLGNWFLPEGYMWKFYTKCDRPRRIEKLIEELCGKEYARVFWKRFYDSYITKKDMEWIQKQGLNSVRLPMNARHLFLVDDQNKVIFQEETLRRLDSCIEWCEEYGLYMFLDMHAAFGGQTGTNIDDSQYDSPELFQKECYEEILIKCWQLLAERYKDNPTVGGYDLLNEPLPDWNKQYNLKVIPLYRKIIKAIREIDDKHMIILEGVHWATDFSIFRDMEKEELKDNILFEFHKYWNNPDYESLSKFVEAAKQAEVPLWMGEGGENNLDWYTTAFPMYERNHIGWCFWSYKKMDTANSPVSFAEPKEWKRILSYLDGSEKIERETACKIFDSLLHSIENAVYNDKVIAALCRKAPIDIPAYAYDTYKIKSTRNGNVSFRVTDPVSIWFTDGHSGEPDWKRYGGEEQPKSEQLEIVLRPGDSLGYRIDGEVNKVIPESDGELAVEKGNDGFYWIRSLKQEVRVKRVLFY